MQSPRDLGFPFDDWRPGQRGAIRSILNGQTTHLVVNAPTGSGKSLIAATCPALDGAHRYVILTATLALQDQYGIFPELLDLRGAYHYRCLAAADEFKDWFKHRRVDRVRCDDGPCHVDVQCSLKEHGCEYYDQKRAFIAAHAGKTSYAAWLANRRAGSPLGVADVLVCDEAHALPEQLMAACRVDIPHHLVDSHKVPRGWKGWARWAVERLDHLRGTSDDVPNVHREQLARGLRLMAGMDASWAWDMDQDGYHFEPTIPRELLHHLQTFDGKTQVVYLSATVTPATLALLDVDPEDVHYHIMPNTFDVARRPVYAVSGGFGNFRAMRNDDNWHGWMDAIDQVCEDRDDRRGLIQPVSFKRGAEIYDASHAKDRMILHERGESASHAVERFRRAGPIAILVSPSIMTGHDFKYQDAEFNIIAKLPFPNTKSSIMRARCRHTARYRDNYIMQHLIQASGRIVRADDDQGETFIVDEDFKWWYQDNRDLAAEWFDEAVQYTSRRVRPMKKLDPQS
jgi:Rad3-related DNA helicase